MGSRSRFLLPAQNLRRVKPLTAWFAVLAFLLALISSARAAAEGVETIDLQGQAMTLRVPTTPAPGKPWLWVAEFAGHLKAFEEGLLARGWHIAYVKVSNQFGSPRAMAAWEKAYAELHGRRGLSARPALLAISRGGLYATAWTRLHPDRVSVLLLDNAVCDARSWPGGFPLLAKGAGSPKDWQLYRDEFRYATDDEARARAPRPADGLEAAVRANVLLISVHGTADRVVPYPDNAAPVVALWEQLGGRVRLFPKGGGDHHPHGLTDYAPLFALLTAEKP